MSRETRKRIFSAVVLLVLVALVLKAGLLIFALLLLLAGILIYDEIAHNFFEIEKRTSHFYLSGLFFFICPFLIYWFGPQHELLRQSVLFTAAGLSTIGTIYLFAFTEKHFFKTLGSRFPPLVGLVLFISMAIFAELYRYESWLKVIILLMTVVYSMDTGAWFFGKNFGKRKLFPSVSPKKTVEGLFGGAFFSTLTSSLLLFAFWNEFVWYYVFLFFVLALLSQVGDLLESKFKRECEIKDSSSLIPGHGGIYDRLDALLFVAPLYFLFVRFLNSNGVIS